MGLIYEIVCNETGDRYIGSTKQTLPQRMANHRQKKYSSCVSKSIIDRNNFVVNILETVENEILRKIEQEWIVKVNCINNRKAFNTPEHIKEYHRQYSLTNNSIIREKRKEQKHQYYLANKSKSQFKNVI